MDDLLNEIKVYGCESMTHPGHLKSHLCRIIKTIQKYFGHREDVDFYALYTAVYLHDAARDVEKRMRREGKKCCHAEVGAELAQEYLQLINYPTGKIPIVVHAIEAHRYSKGDSPETVEARILQECDKLDAMGAIGIIRTLISYPSGDNAFFYNDIEPIPIKRELNDQLYGVDHFFTKLFKLKDRISFEELKPAAQERHDYMVLFIEELEKEVLKNNKEGPVHKILNVIKESVSLTDYDEEEPFKKTPNTLVGKLLDHADEPFIKRFIEQLKSEIL